MCLTEILGNINELQKMTGKHVDMDLDKILVLPKPFMPDLEEFKEDK